MNNEKDLKILVVDDTVIDRQILGKIVAALDGVELVGTAANGKLALIKIELTKPDVVILDIVMPEMDGLETLERIKKQYPYIDVIIISGVEKETAGITVKALEAGALDFIPKPRAASIEASIAELRTSLSRLIPIARTRKYSRQARGIHHPQPPKGGETSSSPLRGERGGLGEYGNVRVEDLREVEKRPVELPQSRVKFSQKPSKRISEKRKPGRIDVVAIGVSTGGPNALQEIIPKLDDDFSLPILIVQHMPAMFTASLAARLDSVSVIKVVEGQDGQIVEKGVIYIAPGGRHMVVRRDTFNNRVIGIVDSPPVNSCRPSVDVLFRSIAMVYEGYVLTVILTGMGNDGVSGVAAIRRKGGYSIVQDEKSSVIWGMPGAVVEADQADAIVSLEDIAKKISDIVKGFRI